MVTLIATQLMNVVFVFGLGLAHAGLALSIGLGACLNAAVLYRFLRKAGIYRAEPGWPRFFGKLGIALLALGVLLWFGMGSEQHWLEARGWPRIIHLSALVIGGMAAYFGVLFALGFRLRDYYKRAT